MTTRPLCWVVRDASGTALRRTEPFETRDEAEAWLTHNWPRLLDEGADSVTLEHGGAELYTMELGPE